jgi:hypothetical protein
MTPSEVSKDIAAHHTRCAVPTALSRNMLDKGTRTSLRHLPNAWHVVSTERSHWNEFLDASLKPNRLMWPAVRGLKSAQQHSDDPRQARLKADLGEKHLNSTILINFPRELAEAISEHTDGLDQFIERAVKHELQRSGLYELLRKLEEELGEPDPGMVANASRLFDQAGE